uniref:Reverse transcriptase domain-containing protein n=1 Tax=Cannabis sativa TaxID=3483 RepID=A0A803QAH8_CANSA
MDPFIDRMKSTFFLTDDERLVVAIADDGASALNERLDLMLVVRILSPKKVWLSTLQNQMSQHWDGRFKAVISEHHSDLFLITFGCIGDKIRALEKEPWHFQGHHIVLLQPSALHSITPQQIIFSPFWVQAYRLPFLSKTQSLAKALGNLIGEFMEVYQDSCFEGWGPFLRFRVRMDITKPLLRGKMISLPNIKDELWNSVMNVFQITVWSVDELDIPTLKGAPLPTSSYDRYRSDFSKGSAWPLLTRLARSTLTATLPQLNNRPLSHPNPLLYGESSNTDQSNQTPFASSVLTQITTPTAPITNPLVPVVVTTHVPTAAIHNSPITDANSTRPAIDTPPVSSGSAVVHLKDVYTPDIGTFSTNHTFATYPPTTTLHHETKCQDITMDFSSKRAGKAIATTIISHQPSSPLDDMDDFIDQENTNPNKTFKRQFDSLSLRKTLKRCRATNIQSASPSSVEASAHLQVSDFGADFAGTEDHSAFNNGLEVPRSGLKGGLMLLWHDDVNVTLLSMNSNYFDCYISYNDGPRWHFSAVYGFPEAINKRHTWTLLERLADVSPLDPWLLVGDLNEIFSHSHKNSGPLRSDNHMMAFRTTLDLCALLEIPFAGPDFTWCKNRRDPQALQERLDWVFINMVWNDRFATPHVTHLGYYGSDHRAILSTIKLQSTISEFQYRSRFCFEKMWIKDAECSHIISNCWNSSTANPIEVLNGNLSQCASDLRSWHKAKYGNFKQQITSAQATVTALSNTSIHSTSHYQQVQQAEAILDDFLASEELYWKQRGRIDWLQSGDQNTKFFHAKASGRFSNNKIKFLTDEEGTVHTSKNEISGLVAAYFENLFQAQTEDHWALQHVLNVIPPTVTDQHNEFLGREFTAADVLEALKTMNGDGSPGIDGMSALFYQHNWHIVGDLVTRAVLYVLNEGGSPEALNKTLITLIPKTKKPKSMKDFRPISLCNVVYKLISKSLVIRFKAVLPHVISKTQSAFLPNRLITDNILVAFELVHCLKHKTRGKKGFSALKLDMSKAFDRVEWSFIAAVMGKMGFSIRWITLILNCLQTTQLSFIINGAISGNVKPQRGLRQGDPLSPYLFLICSEGLSRLLQYEESIGCLKGLAVSRHSPSVSHLLFADDSLLFCEADDRSCGAIKRVLDTYHKASGQQLNTDKSVMSFSPNTSEASKQSFRNILGMPICECHESYLGLPAYSERDKKQLFNQIKERIWKLLNAWTDKIFSVGGKEVLLKAVIQSIPTYAMSCFKLPVKFCHEIESLMSNFWWGSTSDKKKIHWKQWKFLCKSKLEGGLGFRNFIHFNQALLAKQAWRLFQNPESLLFCVLKGRYFSRSDFLSAATCACATDPWIPGNSIFTPIYFTGAPTNTVADYITPEKEWNVSKLNADFSSADVERILSLPLSHHAHSDYWVWHATRGQYEVKSGYHVACMLADETFVSVSSPHVSWWKSFWQLKLPPKVKLFAWKAIHNALPVASELYKRKSLTSASCSLCLNAWESVGHAMFTCKHARHVWKIVGFSFNNKAVVSMKIEDFLFQISECYTKSELEMIFCTMWSIWSDRNNVIHGKLAQQPSVISAKAASFLSSFQSAHQLSLHAGLAPADTPTAHKTWTPPPPTFLKLNVDAAFDDTRKRIGFGAIIRDSTGKVKAAMSHPIDGCCRPQDMEAKGLFYSLKWARQLNFKVDMVETDSLILVNALRKSTSKSSSFQDLIFDVQTQLSYLPIVCVHHVYRDGNQAAHGLAKHALVLDNVCTWLEDFPSAILSVVVKDSLIL